MYESAIIDKTQAIDLIKLCEFSTNQKFILLYRASDDGSLSRDFHKKCDGIKNTLTIIRTTENYIFGGFTGAAWDSANHYINDNKSFIFSLKNCENSPFKARCIDQKYSINGGSNLGPSFGINDIELFTSSDKNKLSTSSIGSSYENPLFKSNILAGTDIFQTVNIEVYEVLK